MRVDYPKPAPAGLNQKRYNMKTFSRTELPEEIIYNGATYKLNTNISYGVKTNNTSLKHISNEIRKQGRKAIAVKVLSKNLRGKKDLRGNLYNPSLFIFTADEVN